MDETERRREMCVLVCEGESERVWDHGTECVDVTRGRACGEGEHRDARVQAKKGREIMGERKRGVCMGKESTERHTGAAQVGATATATST